MIWGAGGGASYFVGRPSQSGIGGYGAYISGDLTVLPEKLLRIIVGRGGIGGNFLHRFHHLQMVAAVVVAERWL